tara:strand:- start:21864 stop:22118 length:255 start_codon:yes stop_codon:yes gene_type:complete
MNNWERLIFYFNSKVSNKIFTRAEIMQYCSVDTRLKWTQTTQTYMNTLKRAGYIAYIEPGVYRKLKKIPENISEYALKKQLRSK